VNSRDFSSIPLFNASSSAMLCHAAYLRIDPQPFRYAHSSNKVFPSRDGWRYFVDVNKELKTEKKKEQIMKKLLRIHQSSGMHWVGNGFLVLRVRLQWSWP